MAVPGVYEWNVTGIDWFELRELTSVSIRRGLGRSMASAARPRGCLFGKTTVKER